MVKLGVFPTAETLARIDAIEITEREDFNAFREAVVDHFARTGATFEVRVQLATSLEETPIEDASVTWPEDITPYRKVGLLTLPAQSAWSTDREQFFEHLSFQPANSLQAHRPLGQVMRARLFVYQKIARYREELNGARQAEERSPAMIPD